MTGSRDRAWFLVRFLAAAGVLFALWAGGGGSDLYARLVFFTAGALSRLSSGYGLEIVSRETGIAAFFVGGGRRLEVPGNLQELMAGVVVFLSLVAATARPRRASWRATAGGLAALYAVHVVIVTMLPLMLTPHAVWVNRLIDVAFVYVVLAGTVALPFFLWFLFVSAPPSPATVASRAERGG